MLKILIFVGIVFIVLSGMKCYVYLRFLRFNPFIPKYMSIGFLVILAIGEVALLLLRDAPIARWQYLLVGSCVVFSYTLFMACLCVDIVCFCFKRISPKDSFIQSRRAFGAKMTSWALALLFSLFSFKAFHNALNLPPVKKLFLRVKNLDSKISIAMISDVHIGNTLGKAFLEGIVERINALNVDIVVIVGDLVDAKIAFVKADLAPLKDLQSKLGVYYVAGNHEYYHGIEPILEYLQSLNLHIVHNTSIEFESFNLAGVSDLAGYRFGKLEPDLEAAKAALNPNKPSILLAHQPKFVYQNDVSDFDVILCGHTHGGQVFPLSLLVWLDQHYVHGLYHIPNAKHTQLYVSSGVGFWGPAIRFLAPSEIVYLELA